MVCSTAPIGLETAVRAATNGRRRYIFFKSVLVFQISFSSSFLKRKLSNPIQFIVTRALLQYRNNAIAVHTSVTSHSRLPTPTADWAAAESSTRQVACQKFSPD